MLDGYADCDENPIVDLFKFLPFIEHLTTWGYLSTVISIHVLHNYKKKKGF